MPVGSAPPRVIHCTMKRTALVSAGVGDGFSGVVAGAWLGGRDMFPEELASALVAGPGIGMVILTVVQ